MLSNPTRARLLVSAAGQALKLSSRPGDVKVEEDPTSDGKKGNRRHGKPRASLRVTAEKPGEKDLYKGLPRAAQA